MIDDDDEEEEDDEETKQDTVQTIQEQPQRIYCEECCPVNANYPNMYLVLLGDHISLHDKTTYNNQTYITRTSHPFSLL